MSTDADNTATVLFDTGAATTLHGAELTVFGADYDGRIYTQLGGWLTPYPASTPLTGGSVIVRADLAGHAVALDTDVSVDVTGHGGHQGGTGRYMILRWFSGYGTPRPLTA